MRFLVSLFCFLSVSFGFSQTIENVDFRAEGKTIVIRYDFVHSKIDTAINVELVFKDQQGGTITPKTISGDLQNVKPGAGKKITWNVFTDGITLSGKYAASVTIQMKINFPSVKIGTQTWMTQNFNVDHFRNGDPIPEVKTAEEWKNAADNEKPVWCYYDNNPANGTKYGKLYNWYAVNDPRGLAPRGWHIPNDSEWTKLTDLLGGKYSENGINEVAGEKMKSTIGWEYNGTNSSGFTGLPGGERRYDGSFYDNQCNWWSSTEYNKYDAWHRHLEGPIGYVYRWSFDKGYGFSVRCLKD